MRQGNSVVNVNSSSRIMKEQVTLLEGVLYLQDKRKELHATIFEELHWRDEQDWVTVWWT